MKAQLMVPNCIFLHLFHISRSTGFLKEKKIIILKERKRAKKHSIHKWNEGIKKQCWLVGASHNPFILPPISFLSSFGSLHRCNFFRENFPDAPCKTAPHSLSVHLPCYSQHFITLYLFTVTPPPDKCKLHGGRTFAFVQPYIPSAYKGIWLLVNA